MKKLLLVIFLLFAIPCFSQGKPSEAKEGIGYYSEIVIYQEENTTVYTVKIVSEDTIKFTLYTGLQYFNYYLLPNETFESKKCILTDSSKVYLKIKKLIF